MQCGHQNHLLFIHLLPVDGDGSKREHAGRADEEVEQGGKVAPHLAKHPVAPHRAGRHKRQHQHRQQQVGQRQAKDELVAGRQQIGFLVERYHDHQVAQADEERDDHYGDRLQGDGPAVPVCDIPSTRNCQGPIPASVHCVWMAEEYI